MISDTQTQPTPSGYELYGNLLTVFLSLALVIVLIVIFIKLLGRRNRLMQMNQSIRLLGGTGLGQNKSMQVVELGDTVYVLGVGEDITLIDKISDPEQVALLLSTFDLKERQAASALMPRTWGNWFKQQRAKRHGMNEDSYDAVPDVTEREQHTFHEIFQSKLDQLPDRQSRVNRLMNDENDEER